MFPDILTGISLAAYFILCIFFLINEKTEVHVVLNDSYKTLLFLVKSRLLTKLSTRHEFSSLRYRKNWWIEEMSPKKGGSKKWMRKKGHIQKRKNGWIRQAKVYFSRYIYMYEVVPTSSEYIIILFISIAMSLWPRTMGWGKF